MLQRTFIAALAIAVLFAMPSAAATLGLYFDPVTFPTETESDGPVTAWLVLREVSPDNTVSGWECSIETVAEGPAPAMVWELLGGGPYNFATPPVFAVGLQVPFPAADDIALARVTIYPAAAGQSIGLHVQPYPNPSVRDADGYPVWRPVIARTNFGDILEVVEPASGASWHPVARVNPGAPVLPPTVTTTGDGHFGAVAPGSEAVRTIVVSQPGPATVYGRLEASGGAYSIRIEGGPWTGDGRWLAMPPGEDVAVDVRFAPLGGGPAYGRLVLADGGSLEVIPLTGGGGEAPALVLAPDHLEFDSVPPGGSSQRAVILRNVGAATLTVTPGTPSADFALLDPLGPFDLEPGAEQTLTVAFIPSGPGLRLLELDLGAGLPPLFGHAFASGTMACDVDVDAPTGGDFGVVVIGWPEEIAATFTNNGSWDLAGDIRIDGDTATFVIVSGGGPTVVPGGASHTVVVRCAPASAGFWQGVLVGPAGCTTVPLSCSAEDEVIGCQIEPDSLGFGSVPIGYATQQAVTVTNTGNVDLVGEVALNGDPEFTILLGGGPFAVPPGEFLVIEVEFAPGAVGEYSAVLEFGDASCGPVPVAGTGRAHAPLCAVDQEVVGFGTAYVGFILTAEVTVQNPGELPLVIDPVVTGDPFRLAGEAGPDTVAAGATASVELEFRCHAAGEFVGSLDLGHSACPLVTLLANGVFHVDHAHDCMVNPPNLYFGSIPPGVSVDRDVSVTNNTSYPLAIDASTSDPAFTVVYGADIVLEPHTAVWLTVRFSPQAPGIYEEHLNVADGGCGPVGLFGEGLATDCSVYPLSIEFPTRVYGSELTAAVLVTNLTPESFLLTPQCDHPEFTATPESLDLPPAQSASIEVTFLADSPGDYAGILDLGLDSCSDVDLAATALDSLVACAVTPESWSLGNVYTGTLYATTIQVTNEGTVPLSLAPAIDPAGTPFTIDTQPRILQPGQHADLAAQFQAAEPGTYAATLILGPECCAVVPFTAVASDLPPGLCEIVPSLIDLGEIPVGLFITRYGSVTNAGSTPLQLELLDVAGQVDFTSGEGVHLLQPGDGLSFTARFYAPQEGDFAYEVAFGDVDCALPVTGYGTPPAYPCEIEPYIVDYGTLVVGQTHFERFSIRNVTDTVLHLDIATQAGPFLVSGGGPRNLGPYNYLRPGATFAPSAPGQYFEPLDLGPDSCGPALLKGTAVASPVGVVALARRLDLGVLDVGETGRLALTIANYGDDVVVVTPAVVGAGFGLADDSQPRALEPGSDVMVVVTCAPQGPGELRGRLSLGLAGHPDVALIAVGRDPSDLAPVVSVVWPDGPDEPGKVRQIDGGTSPVGQLRLSGLAPAAEIVAWRCVLECAGGSLAAWQPAGDAVVVASPAGAPQVILPGTPLRAAADGSVTLATFTVAADGGGEVVVSAHGGAGRDWVVYALAEDAERFAAAVTADPDHVVARFSADPAAEIPGATRLLPVYPNPFNPGTNISFELARSGPVRLCVFDLVGRFVATIYEGNLAAGPHVERWEGRDEQGRPLASGSYYLRLEADGITTMETMTLLR
ncbi:MAG TPA: choice-of-anchor D domain-containing protein [Candidatus Krumholzibacteria bacterium]|nr:choice-of-anchor D domain-containing protein [Candidatus Krumholzibacteria bacterium]HPD70357.1 choice-of-anchor D domain-containing protein [Candidatus Krumholzibacteria bacterium]HRY39943.1 choice-of-anchor D domain-containing protein [Candidatus Krumholzibacteria bacterium]